MALTERYVTATAGGSGIGTEGDPWTLTQAFAAAVAGDRVNIKAGTYTRSANDTLTTDGTYATPIVWRGYNSTIGDLDTVGRSSGTGALITTNMPLLAYNSGYQLNASGADYSIWMNLHTTGTYSGGVHRIGAQSIVYQCVSSNASTNAAARAMESGNPAIFINCDAELTGASGGYGAYYLLSDARMVCCRVLQSQAAGFYINSSTPVLIDCIVDSAGTHGVQWVYSTTTTTPPFIVGLTVYACGGDAIHYGNYQYTKVGAAINCHITDCGGYVFNSEYAGTANSAFFSCFNRTRDNVSGIGNGFADWLSASTIGHVTTDTGGAATDFVDAPGGDFRLISAAPGKAAGLIPYRDIGAIQRQEPTLPAAGDVQEAVQYGEGGTGSTGTFGVPAEADVKTAVQYGANGTEFTGSYGGGGGGGKPSYGDRTGGKF